MIVIDTSPSFIVVSKVNVILESDLFQTFVEWERENDRERGGGRDTERHYVREGEIEEECYWRKEKEWYSERKNAIEGEKKRE